MEQLLFFELISPCKGICTTDKGGYCLGCFRSRDERFNWQTFNDSQKQEVLRLCQQRGARRRYAIFQAQRQQQQLNTQALNQAFDFDIDGAMAIDVSMNVEPNVKVGEDISADADKGIITEASSESHSANSNPSAIK
ncbi:DUF1289 domain-containing protein [Shewanella sp. SNU WT4]|uniref:DUF1289 domain-containing protein n=1 Tax=Shewanella sp. SNU WT4 TaxID=2590015 RepID=UPI00112BEC7B|nr:DUF1289 domain-containing protein [Shewanella sp. SNU WT4]QDF66191.1 DUF1289 domain-containing protein [Shewanella sp. SNU WT4]